MTQQIINLGIADKGNGDVLRTAFGKVNANFAELYNQIATSVVVGATAPTGPEEGALWWNSEGGRMYVYYGTAWVDASPVDGAGISSTNQLVNGAYTTSLGANGVLTLPDGSIINGATLKTIAGNYAGITAGPASPAGRDEDSWVWVDNDGATIATKYSTDNYQWKFDNTGNLILPNGQSIGSGSLDGIKMTTDRGTVLFGNSPECVPTLLTHFHIMKEDASAVDLFLGDDNNYVKLPGDGETAYGVEIGTNVGSAYTWRFGTDGSLTLPLGSTLGETPAAITVTIYGAGASAFNQTYTRTYGDPTYPDQYLGSNDCRIFRDIGTANKWRLREVSTDYYESDDLVTWTDFIGGADPAPTGTVSLKTTDITVGTNTWAFGADGDLSFPDGTTTSGKGITLPVNQSLTVTVSHDEPPPGHTNTFKINPESIKLPTGNGTIFSGTETAANAWHLDSANKTLFFPDAGDGVFPQIKYSTTGNDGMQLLTAAKPIKITVASNTHWTFGTDGTTQFPSNRITQTLDTDLTVRLSETLITDVTSIVPGTGYSNGTATTTGGSGTGLIISINTDGAGHVNQAHNFISLGQGYKLGDVITIVGGNNDAQVTLTGSTPNRDWTFGSDGSLTLPIGVSIDSSVGPLYPKIIADSGKLFSVQGQGNTGSAALAWTVDPDAAGQYAAVSVSRGGGDNLAKVVLQAQSDSGDVATAKTWRFDETGRLTLPATSSILTNETALNIATHPTTTYTFNQAYWAALNGDTARIFTPTFNAQYFACTVTANQNGAYTVAVTGTGNGFVSDNWFKIPGNELGGTSPANDIQITIATVDGGGGILTTTITGTAVSKQWQFSTTGSLTLPDASVIASYKPVTVIAATTTAQTITDSASAAFIQFVDTVDTASAYSTGTFTAPYTGYYQINMSVYFSTTVSLLSTSFLLIDTNLDSNKQVRIIDGGWTGSYLHYSTVISATAGDAIRVAFRQVSGGNIDVSSGSRLTIHRVSIS